MGVITNTKYDARQTDGFTEIHVTTESGDSADTTTVDLSTYGASTISGILGFVETTDGSVVVQEQPTTSVTTGTLTITVGGSSVTSKVRNYIIYAE